MSRSSKARHPPLCPWRRLRLAEFAWGLILATVRHIPREEVQRLREGLWQKSLGMPLEGRTLGIVGLGRIGSRMARYARAFDMNVLAWSHNLTDEKARQAGATRVEKDDLFRHSDIVTIHYVMGDRSRGLVGQPEITVMKPTAYLINTSRGPIVDQGALLEALQNRRIAGAGLDVFDQEPLPKDHPLLALDNVTATPHLVLSRSLRCGASTAGGGCCRVLSARQIWRLIRATPIPEQTASFAINCLIPLPGYIVNGTHQANDEKASPEPGGCRETIANEPETARQ